MFKGLLDAARRTPTPASASPFRTLVANKAAKAPGGFWAGLNKVVEQTRPSDLDSSGLPGPPPEVEWYSAKAPLPPMKLVGGGGRQISGGGRRSF